MHLTTMAACYNVASEEHTFGEAPPGMLQVYNTNCSCMSAPKSMGVSIKGKVCTKQSWECLKGLTVHALVTANGLVIFWHQRLFKIFGSQVLTPGL